MSALKDTLVQATQIVPYVAGDNIGFGVALIRTASKTCKGSMADNAANLIGFSVQPQNGVTLDKDGFYQLVNNSDKPDIVRVARRGSVIRALCITKADTSIVDGDFMEAAPLGDASCYIGVLNEAGGDAGETKIAGACFQAWEDCVMLDESYQSPDAVNVAVGDSTITFVAATMAKMALSVGDYIVLEDLNGDAQLNRVKALTATVITLELPSTVALTATTDYVRKCYQILGQII
jgi:hypothetical protein